MGPPSLAALSRGQTLASLNWNPLGERSSELELLTKGLGHWPGVDRLAISLFFIFQEPYLDPVLPPCDFR